MSRDRNIQKLNNILNRMRLVFNDLPISLYNEVGKYVAERIVAKARTGKTMLGGTERRLPSPLSDSYVKRRLAMKLKGDRSLDPDFFSPRRSNLTLTGQYLKSIVSGGFDRIRKRLTIGPKGRRKDGMTNEELSGHLAKQGRSIYDLDETGRRVVSKMVVNEIRKSIRKTLLRK